jgi:hypothetical protein
MQQPKRRWHYVSARASASVELIRIKRASAWRVLVLAKVEALKEPE